MLCYSNPPAWTFGEAMSNALPYGIIPKPVDTGEPLEDMSKLWNILDSFDVKGAEWHPYFDGSLEVSTEDVRVSYYEKEREMLVLAANMKRSLTLDVSIKLPTKVAEITDAESGEILARNTDLLVTDVESFGHKIFKIKK
jgi:hypothetical protein